MKLHRVTPSLFLIALAGLLAVGCGGEVSKSDYEQQVNAVNQDLEDEFDKFQDGQPTKAEMEQGADIIDGAADDLDEIDPPAEVQDTHEQLVKTVGQLGTALRTMAPALGGGGNKLSEKDEQALVQAQEDSQDAIEGLQQAQKEFKDAGFKIELGAASGGGNADE